MISNLTAEHLRPYAVLEVVSLARQAIEAGYPQSAARLLEELESKMLTDLIERTEQ